MADMNNCFLVIRLPVLMKQEAMQELHNKILKQKEEGFLFLPPWSEVLVVPKDVEIKVEYGEGEQNKSI